MPSTGRLTLVPAAAFAAATLVHLGAHLAGHETLADRSQWALVPLLAVTLATATRPARGRRRSRRVRLTLAALGASWLGDCLPDVVPEEASFLVMVGSFLIAQAVLITAFWPDRDRSVVALGAPAGTTAGRRLLVAPYAVALVALVVACAPGADALLVPVVGYGVALVSMAVLATGVNRLTWTGGAVFLVSDALIALDAFAPGYDLPRHGFWVMATYIGAQVLIVAGVHREERVLGDGAGSPQPAEPAASASTASVS